MQAFPTENKENIRAYGNFYPEYKDNIIHLGQSFFSNENFFNISEAERKTAENLLHGNITVDDHNSDCEYDDDDYDNETPLIYKKIPLANILRPRRRANRRGSRGTKKSKKR
tara:strand:- start:545 stop:880 length:336 start_codon:yes stop_codon:yes gene_type:complete